MASYTFDCTDDSNSKFIFHNIEGHFMWRVSYTFWHASIQFTRVHFSSIFEVCSI